MLAGFFLRLAITAGVAAGVFVFYMDYTSPDRTEPIDRQSKQILKAVGVFSVGSLILALIWSI
jgi:hypothetical protein